MPPAPLLVALRRGAARPLLGGFLVHLCLGTVYAWANTTTYATSALRCRARGGSGGVTYASTFPTYVLALLVQAIFMSPGGALERRVGARRTCQLAGLLVAAGSALAALAARLGSLALLYASAGALFGSGVGLGYVAPLQCCLLYTSPSPRD